jgi:toxin ParE1/3/4
LSNGGFEIWYFVAEDDPVAAHRSLDLLEKKYKLLAGNPHMGPRATGHRERIALSPGWEYLLLYRVIRGGIELVRVARGHVICRR